MNKVSNLNRKIVAIMGILLSCIYFSVVIVFVATGSINWLMIFDILTMFSGIYFAFLIVILPFSKDENIRNNKIMAIIFVSALMIITNIAHSVNNHRQRRWLEWGL
jgi:ABC-type transport system involved in cytochrome c biogenesis permease subunit